MIGRGIAISRCHCSALLTHSTPNEAESSHTTLLRINKKIKNIMYSSNWKHHRGFKNLIYELQSIEFIAIEKKWNI